MVHPRDRSDSSGLVPRSTGAISAEWQPGVAAAQIDYVERSYSMEESWRLLSPETRDWGQRVAGEPILDPLSGSPLIYWYCDVTPSGQSGPTGAAASAEYRLMMFGMRGLAVATGSCSNFRAGQTNSWRNLRWTMLIDPRGVRNYHRRGARAGETTRGNDQETDSAADQESWGSRYLPLRARQGFGNLPVETQRFLLDPFIKAGRAPQDGGLEPTTEVKGGQYVETYLCYLFNKRWVAFACARRSVLYRGVAQGAELWNDSPEARALRSAPWDVAAWVAPVRSPASDVARSRTGLH